MYLFRGKDRLMQQKCLKALELITNRDQLALVPNHKTTQLSTRTLILDDNAVSGLLYDANQIMNQLRTNLSAVV